MAETATLDLESPAYRRAARHEWFAERIGRILIGGMLTAALLGAFGPGLFGERTAQSVDGGLSVSCNRMARYQAPAELEIRLTGAVLKAGEFAIAFSREFVDATTPLSIVPQPLAAEMHAGQIVYTFRAASLTDGGHITYRYQCDEYGPLECTVRLVGGPEATFSQYVLP